MKVRTGILILAAALTIGLPCRSTAASEVGSPRQFGLGGILGAPTGVSGKLFFAPEHALDFAVGVGWLSGPNFHVHADYLFHLELTRTRHFDLPLYVGVGGRFTFWFDEGNHGYWGKKADTDHRVGAAVRVPVGIAFHLNDVPLDPFLELVPGLGIFPGIGFTFDAAIGVRYYF